MCGRFTVANPGKIIKAFGVKGKEPKPIYNAAPSQELPIIHTLDKELKLFRWGLIPSWAKEPSIGYKMINARAETIQEKPSFKEAFKKRRCLILADGFYEWKKQPKGKQPYRITLEDESPFAFAGVWDLWEGIYSFSIITTQAVDGIKDIHERMPVILKPDQAGVWLSAESSLKEVREVLVPYRRSALVAYPVGLAVNSPKNDGAELIQKR